MKYVVLRDKKTGKVRKLGRFSKDALTEKYSLQDGWGQDNSLESDLFDGLLEEITEAEANKIIATEFSREKQAA